MKETLFFCKNLGALVIIIAAPLLLNVSCSESTDAAGGCKKSVKQRDLSTWDKKTDYARDLLFKRRLSDYEKFIKNCETKLADDEARIRFALMLAATGETGRASEIIKGVDLDSLKSADATIAAVKALKLLRDKEKLCPFYSKLFRHPEVKDYIKSEEYNFRKRYCPDVEAKELARDICGIAAPDSNNSFIKPSVSHGVDLLSRMAAPEEIEAFMDERSKDFRCMPSSKHYIMAKLLKKLGRGAEAAKHIEAAIVAEPDFTPAAFMYLSVASENKDVGTKKLLQRLSKTLKMENSNLFERLIAHLSRTGEAGLLEHFVTKWLETVENPFDKERLETYRMWLLAETTKYNDAFEMLEKVGHEGRHRQADDLAAVLMIKSKDHGALKKTLEKRMEKSSFSAPLISIKARLCNEKGEKRCSVDNWLGAAVQWRDYQPWQTRALLWLGRQNMLETALAILKRRVEIEPTSAKFRIDLVKTLLANDMQKELLAYYNKWEKDAKNDPDWVNWLGKVYLDAGEIKRATKLFKKLNRDFSANARYRLNLAKALAENGENEDAMLLSKQAIIEGCERKAYAVSEFLDIHIGACTKLKKREQCINEMKKMAASNLLQATIKNELRNILKTN